MELEFALPLDGQYVGPADNTMLEAGDSQAVLTWGGSELWFLKTRGGVVRSTFLATIDWVAFVRMKMRLECPHLHCLLQCTCMRGEPSRLPHRLASPSPPHLPLFSPLTPTYPPLTPTYPSLSPTYPMSHSLHSLSLIDIVRKIFQISSSFLSPSEFRAQFIMG